MVLDFSTRLESSYTCIFDGSRGLFFSQRLQSARAKFVKFRGKILLRDSTVMMLRYEREITLNMVKLLAKQ